MPLTSIDTIDIISQPLPGDLCKLLLFVSDGGTVADPVERFSLLVAKLTNYLRWVASPQFGREHPGVAIDDVLVRVICATPPTEQMENIQSLAWKGDDGAVIGRMRVEFMSRADMARRLKAN
ncbi:MAG TPA: hypothetical protein VGB15_17035 [Longimicrobium sp.]|jgi:hypothetical protein